VFTPLFASRTRIYLIKYYNCRGTGTDSFTPLSGYIPVSFFMVAVNGDYQTADPVRKLQPSTVNNYRIVQAVL
jgi:hypothetical protein